MSSQPKEMLDERALGQLYTRLEPKLYNIVYRWVWDAHDAQELVQEAFLRLWDMRRRVEMSKVEALVYTIALNLVRKRARAKRLRRMIPFVHDQMHNDRPDLESALSSAQRDLAVRQAIEALPQKYREVIVMCEFSDMTYDAIAQVLGIKPGTVASRRHEAVQRLRLSLKNWNPKEAPL